MKNYFFGILGLLAVFSATIGYGSGNKVDETCYLPSIPENLKATDGTSEDYVYITWDQANQATSYKVFTLTGELFQEVGELQFFFYHRNGIPGKVYEYGVQAWNDCGFSLYSDFDTGYKACPTSGATVQASDGAYGTGIAIVWNDQPYSVRYDVYRSETTYPTDYIGSTQNSYYSDTSSSLWPGKDYYYWVYTVYEFCPQVLSNYDTGYVKITSRPVAPYGVSASDGTYTDRVRITWNASRGATSYEIMRAPSLDGQKTQIGETTTTHYDDTSCSPGTVYYYWVIASNSFGGTWDQSEFDTGYCAGVTPSLPDPPTNIAASDGTYTDRVRVTWSASSGATSYTIYRAASSGGSKTTLSTISSTQYNDTSAAAGTTYYYWVRASNTFGPSGYSSYDTGYRAEVAGQECIPGDTTLCLNNGRFKVQVAWENEQGQFGNGRVVPHGSDDSGLLWFFNSNNWEMLIKVLNGCNFNDRFWVFFAATTDQKFILTVTDTLTGVSKQYLNEMKHPADAVTDTAAFNTCSAEDAIAGEVFEMDELGLPLIYPPESDPLESSTEDGDMALPEGGGCVPSDTVVCLNQDRFMVEVDWKSEDGRSGSGKVVPYGTDDSGMFWFFNSTNWEMLIKVLNGCNFNDNYWVFFAATTDQEFTVRVTDTLTQEVVEYTNPMKNSADAVTDTTAFATCP